MGGNDGDTRITIHAGTNSECLIASGRSVKLKEANEYIGGFVEAVRFSNHPRPDGAMLVDEDGRLKQLPVNDAASNIAGRVIVGKVIVLTPSVAGDWVRA
jgi:hypothetical protein